MTEGREYIDFLRDILDSIEKAQRFTQGMDLERVRSDDKTVFAVVRALEIIGEATKKIPEDVKKRHAGLPWREMAGLRDKLIHDYFGVNLDVTSVSQPSPQIGKMGVSPELFGNSRAMIGGILILSLKTVGKGV